MLLQLVFTPTTAPKPYNWAVFARDMYGSFYRPEDVGINYSYHIVGGKYGFIYEYLATTGEFSRVLFFKLPENPYNIMPTPILLGTLCLCSAWLKYHNLFSIYTASGDNLNQDINAAVHDARENMSRLIAKYGDAVRLLHDVIKTMPETAVTLPQQLEINKSQAVVKLPPQLEIKSEVIHAEVIQSKPIKLEPSSVEEEQEQIVNAKQASLETLAEELSKIQVKTPEPILIAELNVIPEQLNATSMELPAKKKKKKKKKASQANSGMLSWIHNHKPNIDIQTAKQIGISAAVAAAGGLANGTVSDEPFITPRIVATTGLLFMGTFSALRARSKRAEDVTVSLATKQIQHTMS